MSVRRFFARREYTAKQRIHRAVVQTCVWLGLLTTTRGLASGSHWVFNPDAPYQVGAFAPLSLPVAAPAVLVGLTLLITAAAVADRSARTESSHG